MLELSKKIVKEEIRQLQYKGFELDSFFNKENERHEEAVEEVYYWSCDKIRDKLLDKASAQLSKAEEGEFLWWLIYNNIEKEVEKQVYEILRPYE